MAFFWYDSVPTIMASDGTTTYLNCDDRHYPKDAPSQEWVTLAKAKGEPVTIVTRQAVVKALAKADAKAVTDAKLKAETLDVAAPTTGTAAAKAEAVAAKLSTVVSPAEWEKVATVAATIKAEAEPLEEKTIGS